jgi:hypothetical protein
VSIETSNENPLQVKKIKKKDERGYIMSYKDDDDL